MKNYDNLRNIARFDMSDDVLSQCPEPVINALSLLQGKWKNLVLFELAIHEKLRFGELKKNLSGITNTMLTSTLRDLEDCGLIVRIQFNEIPPHVEYSLTEKGKDLTPVFHELYNWAAKYNIR